MSWSSSDGEGENDQSDFVIGSTLRDSVHIPHPGKPNTKDTEFAPPTVKRLRWPDDLWDLEPPQPGQKSPTMVYNLRDTTNCLGPPQDSGDKRLRFDSKFESGNLMAAYVMKTDTYHLVLEYDHNGSGSCQWFYFEMSNIRRDARYQFYISGFHKNSGVFKAGAKVFWYSTRQFEATGIGWSRGGTNYGYGVDRSGKSKRATLQFQMKFPFDDDKVYLCCSLPYTYTDLMNNISVWQGTRNCDVHTSTLCLTAGGRPCPLLTLTGPGPQANKDCILLTGRIHPGESNGSYVLHGLIDFLVSSHPAARSLLERHIIKIVPMVNVDGVVEGCYRTDYRSVTDLNRVWRAPDRARHPVVCAVKDLAAEIGRERKIAVYMDFHGHSRLHGTFIYGCPNEDEDRNVEKVLPRMISYLSDAFSWGRCVFSYPPGKRKDASRIVMRREFNIIQSFTVETSFGGIDSGPRASTLYDETIWKELGAKCGESVYHLLATDVSPLRQYVVREMSFMSPTANDDEEAPAGGNTGVQLAVASDGFEGDDIAFVRPRVQADVGGGLVLKPPTTFLVANSRVISTQSPGYVAPRWVKMQLTPR